MSDQYLFKSKKTGFQMQIFGVSLKDARETAHNINSNLDMQYIGKNIQASKYTCGCTTERQMEINRMNLQRLLGIE